MAEFENDNGDLNTEEDDILDVVIEGEEDSAEEDDNEGSSVDGNDEEEDEDDDHLKSSDEDEDEDEEGGEEDSDEDREAIREKRRQNRINRKKRAKEREATLRRELSARDRVISDLTNRLNTIERRGTSTDLAQVDNTLNQLNQAYIATQSRIKEAIENNEGDVAVQAIENLNKIQHRAQELNQIRTALQQQSQRPQPLDPRLAMNAKRWLGDHNWYKPEGRDSDSRIVRRIDNDLASEGWDPTTEEYWDELTSRVKKELPHRYEKDYNNNRKGKPANAQQKRKQIVMGSGTNNARGGEGSGSSGNRKAITISKERREALMDAGLWDDPKLRTKAIREMQLFDQQNKKSS